MPPSGAPGPWLWSIGVPLVLGLAAWGLGLVRRSAVLAGVPLGIITFRLGGLGGFVVLLGFFLLGTALTRIGYATKDRRGVAEASGGRRGASHVAANCGVGLLILVLQGVLRVEAGCLLDVILRAAFVASFATAASDTASSEIGQLLGRHPFSLRTFRRVPVGAEGAVSLEGLLGGAGAALAMAGLGAAVGLVDGTGLLAVASGGFAGNVLESLAGAWGRKALPHGWLNAANTLVGAALAALLIWFWQG